MLPSATYSFARSINNNGQIVGESQVGSGVQQVLWQNGEIAQLGSSWWNAKSINDSGQIAGTGGNSDGMTRAVVWQNDSATELGAYPGTSTAESRAYGINDAGDVVGYSFWYDTGDFYWLATLWKSGKIYALGPVEPIPARQSEALDINNFGQAVGWSTVNHVSQAALWQDGLTTTLPMPGGSPGEAHSINDAGQIVGWFSPYTDNIHAFIWENGRSTDLGTFGNSLTYAEAINNRGQVVGYSQGENGCRPFIWEGGSLVDLNDLVSSESNWLLETAMDINDAGQIIGAGRNPAGQVEAFLLTPVPEPSSLLALICGLSGLGGVIWRRKRLA